MDTRSCSAGFREQIGLPSFMPLLLAAGALDGTGHLSLFAVAGVRGAPP